MKTYIWINGWNGCITDYKFIIMRIEQWSGKWMLFSVFLAILILDRVITMINFGFIYTDIDQMVMWNGAVDYSKGIFHEPYFYGQAYNYMLESFLAAPLLWFDIPVYIALPVTTTILSILPFIALSVFFMNRKNYFWAFLCLAFPIILPLPYNFLNTISRGLVQSHIFIPLLFIPLFDPQSKKNVTILYLASAVCIIANPVSILIVLPISLLVFLHHYKSPSFYIKSLLTLPFVLGDLLAKHFYKVHPERVLHKITGLRLESDTFLESFKNGPVFKNLFPFFPDWGIIYLVIFTALAFILFSKSMKKEFIFALSILFLLLITWPFLRSRKCIQAGASFLLPAGFTSICLSY